MEILFGTHRRLEEAESLFNKIVDSIAQYSDHLEVWNYYDGYFDIKVMTLVR